MRVHSHAGTGCLFAVLLFCAAVCLAQPGGERIVPTDPLDSLLRAVSVDTGVSYRGLTLFPVRLRTQYSDLSVDTFDEAVRRGDLEVREVENGEVGSVRVRNHGGRPVFIMAGEIMTGSRQDRTARQDALIAPNTGWVRIPVYCVEAGRWTQISPQFGSGKSLAGADLRLNAYAGETQQRIWEEVDRAAAANSVTQSMGKPLQEVFSDEAVRRRLDEYSRGLAFDPGRDCVGLVTFSGTRVIAADLLATPALFRELQDKLVRSYVISAGRTPSGWKDEPSAHDAARFLALAWSEGCRRIPVDSPGAGSFFRLQSTAGSASGGLLTYRTDAVHCALFPHSRPVPVPEPVPIPIPVPRPFQEDGRR